MSRTKENNHYHRDHRKNHEHNHSNNHENHHNNHQNTHPRNNQTRINTAFHQSSPYYIQATRTRTSCQALLLPMGCLVHPHLTLQACDSVWSCLALGSLGLCNSTVLISPNFWKSGILNVKISASQLHKGVQGSRITVHS